MLPEVRCHTFQIYIDYKHRRNVVDTGLFGIGREPVGGCVAWAMIKHNYSHLSSSSRDEIRTTNAELPPKYQSHASDHTTIVESMAPVISEQ